MDDTLAQITVVATAELLLASATDPMDVVDLLLERHGFDRTFQALAALGTPQATRAMWAALCCLVFDDAVE